MKTLGLIVGLIGGLLFLMPGVAVSQEVCPCIPLTYQWIVTPCETWNCAAAATVMSNGDKYVLAMPTGSDDFKWVVIKRIVSGSAIISPDAPFTVDSFDGMAAATTRYDLVGHELQPMLLTAPDGKVLVIARNPTTKRRAVGH